LGGGVISGDPEPIRATVETMFEEELAAFLAQKF
jgi:hypothetical protein